MLTTLKRFGLPIQDLKTIYIGFIRPLVEYAVPAWHPGLSEQQHLALERFQKAPSLGVKMCGQRSA